MHKYIAPFFIYTPGDLIRITVKPGTACNELIYTQDTIIVRLTAPAKDGRANAALIKFLKKSYGMRVAILKGHTSRVKTLQLLSIMPPVQL